jgi:hypothetical protein
MRYLLLIFLLLTSLSHAQAPALDLDDEDELNIGGDIFSDFNEDIEDAQVLEDERFYRYGRFFSFQVGIGLTTFDGNRGIAYENHPPTYALGYNYFKDFHSSFGLGLEFSKHSMFIADSVQLCRQTGGCGLIEVNITRTYFSYRYYIDTTNLGTAITYSNPYLTGRLEYWYVTNKYKDRNTLPNDTGGGLGLGLGFGLEFPIVIKESYLNLEMIYHSVSFHDKFTSDYQPTGNSGGFQDLAGNVFTTMVHYVFNW